MSSEVGQNQSELHPSVQVVRRDGVQPTALARDRGLQWQLVGPDDGSAIDLHRIALRPGSVPGHYHRHTSSENVYLVLEGSLDVRHPDGVTRLEAGDAIRIPRGVAHSATSVGPIETVLLELYFPAPADFVRVEDHDDASS